MDGSATFTIVASKTIISIPVHSTTRAIQRERLAVLIPGRPSMPSVSSGSSVVSCIGVLLR